MPTKILAYHHVLTQPELPVGPEVTLAVSPEDLRACIKAHEAWTFVDYTRALASCGHGDRRVLVTIDDGYRDLLTTALPILEAHDVPCVVFVVTGYLDGTARPIDTDIAWLASRMHPKERESFYDRHSRRVRRGTPAEQVAWVHDLVQAHGLPDPPARRDQLLTWDEVIELSRHPLVTIGSHSVTHPMLSPMQLKRAAREAEASKARLEQRTGRPVECFAYPYGRQSMMLRRGVARADYRYAFTNRGRMIDRTERLDPTAVPRFVVDERGDWGPIDVRAAAPLARAA